MRLVSAGQKETIRIGEKLGRLLGPGDTVYLYGDLGAGKTVLAKGIARAFGIGEREITSASFTIIAEHEGSRGGSRIPFYHIDLYRLEGAIEAEAAGIEDCMGGEGVAVVEWAERLSSTEEGAVTVRIKIAPDNRREIIIEGVDEADWDNRQGRH